MKKIALRWFVTREASRALSTLRVHGRHTELLEDDSVSREGPPARARRQAGINPAFVFRDALG